MCFESSNVQTRELSLAAWALLGEVFEAYMEDKLPYRNDAPLGWGINPNSVFYQLLHLGYVEPLELQDPNRPCWVRGWGITALGRRAYNEWAEQQDTLQINKSTLLYENLTPRGVDELINAIEPMLVKGIITDEARLLFETWRLVAGFDERQALLTMSVVYPQKVLHSIVNFYRSRDESSSS